MPWITVHIHRLLPFGLLVRLADGREGIIRDREITWDRHARRRWREHFKVGDAVQAVLLREGHEQRPELS